MKLTKTSLKQIIKEELRAVLKEANYIQNLDAIAAAQGAWRGSKDHIEYKVEKSALNIDNIINALKKKTGDAFWLDQFSNVDNVFEALITPEMFGSEDQLRDWIHTYYNEYKIIKDKRVPKVPNSEKWYNDLEQDLMRQIIVVRRKLRAAALEREQDPDRADKEHAALRKHISGLGREGEPRRPYGLPRGVPGEH